MELPQSSTPNQQFNSQAGFQQQPGMGMNQGNMGMNQGNMGMNQGNMGMNQGNMGMNQGNMGMGPGGMGMGPGGMRTSSPYTGNMQNPMMNSQPGGGMMGGATMMNGGMNGPNMMGQTSQMNNQLAVYQPPSQQMFGQVRGVGLSERCMVRWDCGPVRDRCGQVRCVYVVRWVVVR